MGEQFLARAALSEEQGGDVALRGHPGKLHRVDDDVRFPQNVGEPVDRLRAGRAHGELLHPGGFGQSADHSLVLRYERRGKDIAFLRVPDAERGLLVHDSPLLPENLHEGRAVPHEVGNRAEGGVFFSRNIQHAPGVGVGRLDASPPVKNDNAVRQQLKHCGLIAQQIMDMMLIVDVGGNGMEQGGRCGVAGRAGEEQGKKAHYPALAAAQGFDPAAPAGGGVFPAAFLRNCFGPNRSGQNGSGAESRGFRQRRVSRPVQENPVGREQGQQPALPHEAFLIFLHDRDGRLQDFVIRLENSVQPGRRQGVFGTASRGAGGQAFPPAFRKLRLHDAEPCLIFFPRGLVPMRCGLIRHGASFFRWFRETR